MGDVAAIRMRRDLGPRAVLWSPERARRCLFGPPDPNKKQTFLETNSKKIKLENTERWNFDFEKGVPLNGGRFKWIPVNDVHKDCVSSEKDGSSDAESVGKNEQKQTLITDFMRKRKLSSSQKDASAAEPRFKTRRRFST